MKVNVLLKVTFVNLLIMILLLCLTSFSLRMFYYSGKNGDTKQENNKSYYFDSNTIRSTYPMYDEYTKEYALNIFDGYSKPKMFYSPFIGWRRKPYTSLTVNIEDKYRTRLSVNHKVNGSVWFFGGSTMWGTGVDDENTVPSLYAKKTGDAVWNLGESAFNSFQEYIQLSILLAKGLKPKMVVFYDGVNESQYCNTNNKLIPTHVRVEKMQEFMDNYDSIKKENKELMSEIKILEKGGSTKKSTSFLSYLFKDIFEYFSEPIVSLYKEAFDNRVIGYRKIKKYLKADIPFSDFKPKGGYKDCNTSEEKANAAAQATIEVWLMAHSVLKDKNIPFKVFLQPTASLKPELLKINYLINREKQIIINEKANYNALYNKIREKWKEECGKYSACSSFNDLSSILDDVDEDLYIDSMHLSKQGNKLVVDGIVLLEDN